MRSKLPMAPEATSVAPEPPQPLDREQKAAAVEALKEIGGSSNEHWNAMIVGQVTKALWLANGTRDQAVEKQVAAVAAMRGIGPKDEVEGMLAAQMVAAHNAAMECYRRAMIGEQTFEGRRENLSQANKLSRSYALLLEALNRHRGKGQQKVTVEHVHVHSGGQAVVGIVENSGRGSQRKSEDQCDAKQIAHAPQPTMRSADKEREPLPVAGDAERPLPNARRKLAGSADGK
jgi:hypothetical protein